MTRKAGWNIAQRLAFGAVALIWIPLVTTLTVGLGLHGRQGVDSRADLLLHFLLMLLVFLSVADWNGSFSVAVFQVANTFLFGYSVVLVISEGELGPALKVGISTVGLAVFGGAAYFRLLVYRLHCERQRGSERPPKPNESEDEA